MPPSGGTLAAWPAPAEQVPAGRADPRSLSGKTRGRLGLAVLAAVLAVAGLVASLAGGAVQVLPRQFSRAQQRQIMAWQVASRWRTWQAGRIFPASVRYTDPAAVFDETGAGLALTARRVGIAPQASCAAATDGALARVLQARGCTAVLRATYTDATRSFVITLGVAVMHGTAPPARSLPAAPGGRDGGQGAAGQGIRPGVRPVAFRGTLAARFGTRQRQLAGEVSYGPYLVLYTAGYTDGRRRDQVAANPYIDSEMTSVASGLASAVGARLGAAPPPPKCPGSPGC